MLGRGQQTVGHTFVGRRAVVTGAAAGIGRAVAVQLAAHGAGVMLWDQDLASLSGVAELCRRFGGDVAEQVVDVADAAAVSSAADGLGPTDLLLCLAGVIHTGTLLDSEPADLEHVVRTNLWGTVYPVRAVLPQLIASGRGQVVTVSSAFGLIAAPRYTAYCASKFAVRGFSEALGLELATSDSPVVVSCVYPGGVRTQIVRSGTFAPGESRDEIAGLFERRIARTTPERAAMAILRGVARGRTRILIGSDAHAVSLVSQVTGSAYQRILPRVTKRSFSAGGWSRRA